MSAEQPNQHTGWDLPKRIWGKISEPRVINFATWIGYWHALIPGVYSIFQPPSSIQGAIGDYAMLVIAILVTIGGAMGLLTCLNGAWWLERWAVVSLIAGVFMYYLIVITLHVSSPGNRLLQAGIIGCAICLLVCRLLRVSTRQQDPNVTEPKHR